MTSAGVLSRVWAPVAQSSSAVRKPHSAPAANMPAATAVLMSVSVSPR